MTDLPDKETLREQALELFREVSSESFYMGLEQNHVKPERGPFGDNYLGVFADAVVALVYPENKEETL